MIDYSIDADEKLVRVRLSGSSGFAELSRHLERLMTDESFHPTYNTLIQVDERAYFELFSWSHKAAALLETWADHRAGTKWAVVAPSETQRAIARILLSHFRLGSVTLRVFPDMDTAIAWLHQEPAGFSEATPAASHQLEPAAC